MGRGKCVLPSWVWILGGGGGQKIKEKIRKKQRSTNIRSPFFLKKGLDPFPRVLIFVCVCVFMSFVYVCVVD